MPACPAAAATLHMSSGRSLGTEATTFTAGQSLTFPNSGNTVLHVNATLAGTAVVQGLIPANNVNVTLALGNNLLGPYPQALYGQTVTVTTATATGSAAAYAMPTQIPAGYAANNQVYAANGLHNPFETNPLATDY